MSRVTLIVAWLAVGLVFAVPNPACAAPAPEEKDNEELALIYEEDQADRKPASGASIDWSIVAPRDAARLARVKQLYTSNALKTGPDFYHAAMVLQHGDGPDDYLLAHELCVVALSKGYMRALWLAGAAEDRFLRAIGRPQRFGTQYRSEGGGGTFLQETDPTVTDEHRRLMKAPPLAEAKSRAARFDGGAAVSLAPVAGAPALTQDLFTATDDGTDALEKVRKYATSNPSDILRLMRGCHDLVLRYAAPHVRGSAYMLALDSWRKLTRDDIARLNGWTPAEGEDDAALSAEQRAAIAHRLAYSNAARRSLPNVRYDESVFEEMVTLARKHLPTRAARDALHGAAISASPENAIPRLRELLPNDPQTSETINQLERLGRSCELEITTLDRRTLSSSTLRGKVVVVHFFAKRFSGSENVVAKLAELAARHGDRLALIGINMDKERRDAEAFVAEHAVTWPVQHDASAVSAVGTQFRAKILPYYLLIDSQGVLVMRGVQFSDPVVMKKIESLLEEARSSRQ